MTKTFLVLDGRENQINRGKLKRNAGISNLKEIWAEKLI
jgi:hypothetical protein